MIRTSSTLVLFTFCRILCGSTEIIKLLPAAYVSRHVWTIDEFLFYLIQSFFSIGGSSTNLR